MSTTAAHIGQAPACIDAGCGIGLVVVDSSRRGIDPLAGARRLHSKLVAANVSFVASI